MGKLGKLVYWGLLIIIVISLATPGVQLLGDAWEIVLGISSGNIEQTDAIKAIGIMITIILIAAVLWPLSDNFKSPLYYGLRNLGYSIDRFSEETDVEAKKQVLQRSFAYGAYLFVIYIIYAYLIWSLKNNAVETNNIVSILGFLGLISVIGLGNTWGVAQLVAKNGDVEVIPGEGFKPIEATSSEGGSKQGGNNLLLVLVIIVANIVLLSVGLVAKNNVENFLTESGAGDVLEGNAEGVFGS